jgi:hypothetical protein
LLSGNFWQAMGQAPLLVVVMVMMVERFPGLLPTMGLAPLGQAQKTSPNSKKNVKKRQKTQNFPPPNLKKSPNIPQKSQKKSQNTL